MTNLKAMPMYRHMKEDSLRMIVLELQIRQQQQRANAEKDFKTSKMQLSWLESRYRKTVQDAANLNGMIALAKAAANGPNSIINLTLDTESDNAMKNEASGFARSSFQSMLNQQNKQITSTTPAAEAKASGETPHLTDSSAPTSGADKGAKPLTIDLTEADSEHPASVNKPTDHKPPLPINVDPTSLVEASAKKATPPSRVNENGKKKASYEISEDSENEDDWEATYSRNARNRSRRTRS
uniref:Uncharacterized protein n=1 Tax=Ciona savignyi TaxID=51511 RepID=H2YE05_CIOSA